MPSCPPPQAVVNQRPAWLFLIALLGGTLLLRLVALDVLGTLLCGLLMLLSAVIIRDGMHELPKFSLLFGLLCGINLSFNIMTTVSSMLGGRVSQHVDPLGSQDFVDANTHTHQLTYTLTVHHTPFFDATRGLLYNVQSVGMIAMPVSMLLGMYLGISAHMEILRLNPAFANDFPDRALAERQVYENDGSDALLAGQLPAYGSAGQEIANQAPAKPFQGTAYKLEADP